MCRCPLSRAIPAIPGEFIRQQQQVTRSAFTLIELLVVVTIIVILVALLFPAINTVRQSAMKVKCANNMRQMGMMIVTYTGDNKGLLPPAFVNNGSWSSPFQLSQLNYGCYLFLGQYEPVTTAFATSASGISDFQGTVQDSSGKQHTTTWKCPSDLRKTSGSHPRDVSYGLNTQVFSHIDSNTWYNHVMWGNAIAGRNAARRIAQIMQPSNTVAAMECANSSLSVNIPTSGGAPAYSVEDLDAVLAGVILGSTFNQYVPWHGRGTGSSILFCDGRMQRSQNPTADYYAGTLKYTR